MLRYRGRWRPWEGWGSWEGAVGFFPLKGDVGRVFEEAEDLVRREDGAEFDVAVLFKDAEALAGLEGEGVADLLRDDDLEFGGQNGGCHTK